MMSRISAEFESPELAEYALARIRNSISGVYRTGVIYNRKSDKAVRLRSGSLYTVIPTAVTTYNYITAVTESPASEDIIPEPYRSRTAKAFVICDASNAGNVSSLFNAFGGLSIRSEI